MDYYKNRLILADDMISNVSNVWNFGTEAITEPEVSGLVQLAMLRVRSLKFASMSNVAIFYKLCRFQLKVAILLDVRLLLPTPDDFPPYWS